MHSNILRPTGMNVTVIKGSRRPSAPIGPELSLIPVLEFEGERHPWKTPHWVLVWFGLDAIEYA